MLILLDIDGTLVDTNYLHVDAWARAFHQLGLVIPRAAIHRQIGKGSDQFLPQFIADPDQQKAADRLHLLEYQQLSRFGFALPGARELLEKLHADGHRLWMATSAKPQEIAERLEMIRVDRAIIQGQVTAGDVQHSKPAPDIFLAALERANGRAEDTLVIGDTSWDMLAARGAGIRGVAVLSGGAFSRAELHESGATTVYEDCAEMVAKNFPAGF
ncbi:MAG TPA: HAD family hydrolase [Polyangia bacterium]|nr:HAD family hydrolase [Polyangia bacterium]HWE28958.1 HAD family hydrolase [Polyangia bacterium]